MENTISKSSFIFKFGNGREKANQLLKKLTMNRVQQSWLGEFENDG